MHREDAFDAPAYVPQIVSQKDLQGPRKGRCLYSEVVQDIPFPQARVQVNVEGKKVLGLVAS